MDIFAIFRAAADAEKAVQMQAYMRDQFPFLGLQKPQRTKLSKDFLRAQKAMDWDFVNQCWQQPEREFQYLAASYLIKLKQLLTFADIPKLKELIVTKSWWDTVDSLDIIVGDIAMRYPQVNEILLAWSVDDNIWLRRTAIDHQLLRKEKTDTALLEQIIINNLGQKEFFINKAIGWSLREYSKTDPNWVRYFIASHRTGMAELSIREASKYL